MKLIGLIGFIGSGKDTVGGILSEYGYKQMSFADSLKDSVSCIFGWDRKLLDGKTKESREFRNMPDEFWSKKLGKEITPRYILQYFGTEVCRENFSENIWLNSLERKLTDKVVVTDVRFKNEYDFIHSKDGIIIRVIRDKPEWFDIAVDAEKGNQDSIDILSEKGVHKSEYDLISTKADLTIINNKDIKFLKQSVKNIISILE